MPHAGATDTPRFYRSTTCCCRCCCKNCKNKYTENTRFISARSKRKKTLRPKRLPTTASVRRFVHSFPYKTEVAPFRSHPAPWSDPYRLGTSNQLTNVDEIYPKRGLKGYSLAFQGKGMEKRHQRTDWRTQQPRASAMVVADRRCRRGEASEGETYRWLSSRFFVFACTMVLHQSES